MTLMSDAFFSGLRVGFLFFFFTCPSFDLSVWHHEHWVVTGTSWLITDCQCACSGYQTTGVSVMLHVSCLLWFQHAVVTNQLVRLTAQCPDVTNQSLHLTTQCRPAVVSESVCTAVCTGWSDAPTGRSPLGAGRTAVSAQVGPALLAVTCANGFSHI